MQEPRDARRHQQVTVRTTHGKVMSVPEAIRIDYPRISAVPDLLIPLPHTLHMYGEVSGIGVYCSRSARGLRAPKTGCPSPQSERAKAGGFPDWASSYSHLTRTYDSDGRACGLARDMSNSQPPQTRASTGGILPYSASQSPEGSSEKELRPALAIVRRGP